MKKIIFLFIIVIFSMFQLTILDYFKILDVKPDLFLITVVISSLFFELKWAMFFGIFNGILKDVFSVNTFGINTLLFPLWSFLTMKLSKRISIDNNFIFAAFIFVILFLNNIIIRLIFIFLGKFFIPLSTSLRIALLESMYTAIVSPLVLKVIGSLEKYLSLGRQQWQ